MGPPGCILFAQGSKPVIPRQHERRNRAGTEPNACRQAQRLAANRPYRIALSLYSDCKSASTSPRSAMGVRDRMIAATTRGSRRERLPCEGEGIVMNEFYNI